MKKIICGIFAALMLMTSLTGCLDLESFIKKEEKYSEFPTKLTAEKVGSIEAGNKYFTYADGGIYYKENDKYGVMSLDGKHDTGAIYSYCRPKSQFFMVATDEFSDEMTIENLNNVGVIDGNGKMIVPTEYASIDVLNERFIKVCKVTEQTNSKDDALVFYSENSWTIFAGDGDTLFKGNWYVFDSETGKQVNGVSGTKAYSVTACGNYIKYTTDDGKSKRVNEKGEALPEDARLLENGSYIIEKLGNGSAYDTNAKKLFDYSTDDYEIAFASNNASYYIARKYVDTEAKYMVVDTKGEVVSVEYDDIPQLYGNFVFTGNKIYDFKGNVVVNGEFERVSMDGITNAVMLTTADDEVVIFKDGGDIIYKDTASDIISIDSSSFTMSKKTDDGRLYYSLKDKDYTIKGSSVGAWTVKTLNDGAYHLVDTISGDIIISGYKTISYPCAAQSSYYVYAEKNGTIDVYLIKS